MSTVTLPPQQALALSPKPTAVHFGAGNIGRGFIGPLLAADHHVIFADVVNELIDALNSDHAYTIHVVSADNRETQTISDVSAISTKDSSHTSDAIIHADIVTTSVGPGVLPRIAPALANGLRARARANKGTLNIIACENLLGATDRLKDEVEKALKNDPSTLAYLSQHVGFANCTVDRIVPPFEGEDILDVAVEDFYEWIVDRKGLKDPIPNIDGMRLSDDLDAYVERKLFTLNAGHAFTAYTGILKGHQTISECMEDPPLRSMVEAAMNESGDALVKKHGFDAAEHEKYVHTILNRFANPELKDDLLRVGRAPLRKLAKDDRLVGPVNMAREYGLRRDHLLIGVAAALLFNNPEDEESVQVQQMIKEEGIRKAITKLTGIPEDSEDFLIVLKEYRRLQDNPKNRL